MLQHFIKNTLNGLNKTKWIQLKISHPLISRNNLISKNTFLISESTILGPELSTNVKSNILLILNLYVNHFAKARQGSTTYPSPSHLLTQEEYQYTVFLLDKGIENTKI